MIMAEAKKLYILWTNDNVHTSQAMVMMYATKSMLYRCWDAVTVIIWGVTAQLAAENEAIQEHIKVAQNVGVKFSACVTCARQFGAVDKFRELGIEVEPWVEPLTAILQSGETILTV
jgi:hypothetical protein